MASQELNVNLAASSDQDIYIDNDDVYVNRTGDTRNNVQSFIHNTCEILFVEDGEAEYVIHGRKYPVRKNGILIISATDMHMCHITRTPYIRYGIYFMPKYLERLMMIREYLDVYRTPDEQKFVLLQNLPDALFEEFCNMIQQIYHEQVHHGDDSILMRDILVCKMTVMLNRLLHYKKETRRTGDSFALMLKVRDYIDQHYADDCSLNRLADEFYIQPETISRNFKAAFDTTVGNYLTLIRLSNAARLLESNGESITQIAQDVGYANINTFIRAFTKVMKTSPLQYRKKRMDYWKIHTLYEVEAGDNTGSKQDLS